MSQKLTSKVAIPKDSNYIIRCTEEKFGPSKSSGNPMITLNFEVVAPEEVIVKGEAYNIAGARVSPMYLTTQSMKDGEVDVEKTSAAAGRIEKMYNAFGLDFSTFNPENPTLGFKGKEVFAALYADEDVVRKDPTPEQLKRGEQGDPQVNPVTGKDRIQYFTKIDEIFGLAKKDPTKPY